MAPWHFTSNDGRIDLTFKPIIDRAAKADVLAVKSDQHQVFGRFYGTCIPDDGREIKLDGPVRFAEKAVNKW